MFFTYISTEYSQTFFGAWKNGYNAGGQVSHSSFNSNPHILFEIPGSQGKNGLVLLSINMYTMYAKGKELSLDRKW